MEWVDIAYSLILARILMSHVNKMQRYKRGHVRGSDMAINIEIRENLLAVAEEVELILANLDRRAAVLYHAMLVTSSSTVQSNTRHFHQWYYV